MMMKKVWEIHPDMTLLRILAAIRKTDILSCITPYSWLPYESWKKTKIIWLQF